MPEGPEVRTVADSLKPHLTNRIITDFYLGDRANTKGFDHLKCPVKIINVRSYGKKIIFDLGSGHIMITSLKMEGRLQYDEGNHSHIRFDISNLDMKYVFSLYFDDYRYMGGIDVIPNSEISNYFAKIGVDLLQYALKEETWISLDDWINIYSRGTGKRKIYTVLLDPSLNSTIGNYLCCVILYYAGIRPDRVINTLSRDEWDNIRIFAHKIISFSYERGGCTHRSYINPSGEMGAYPCVVYNQTRDPYGNNVITTKITGRTAHWVPEIQI